MVSSQKVIEGRQIAGRLAPAALGASGGDPAPQNRNNSPDNVVLDFEDVL
jgi:hypothetical protein